MYHFRAKNITISKNFYNKFKTITYPANVWTKAEKYFPTITAARESGSEVKINITGDLYLSSKVWGENQQRYTGIHAFHVQGYVKPHTGINLTDDEWNTLADNFFRVKEFLAGERVNLSTCKRRLDFDDHVNMYVARWMLNGNPFDKLPSTQEHFLEDKAIEEAYLMDPEGGITTTEEGKAQITVERVKRASPADTDIMFEVLVEIVFIKLGKELKKNCEACQVDSDSQFEHARSGNCLDDTMDTFELYYEKAKQNIQVNELMAVFDDVRKKIGLKPTFSKSLAKGILAWISKDQVVPELKETERMRESPLQKIVRMSVYEFMDKQ